MATADVAFEAWGGTLEEMFTAAADATMNVMVEELATIADRQRREMELECDEVDMLLFQFMQEFIFFKDAQRLVLRVRKVDITEEQGKYRLVAEAYGEEIDKDKHELPVDVKAVTLHRFQVQQTKRGWQATVILDI